MAFHARRVIRCERVIPNELAVPAHFNSIKQNDMKGLFINRSSEIIGGHEQWKSRHSKNLMAIRYNKCFFTNSVFKLYTLLNFISAKFHFDVKQLLESTLEGIYNDAKIGQYVYQIKCIEEKEGFVNRPFALLAPVLKEYMDNLGVGENKSNCVLKLLNRVAECELWNSIYNSNMSKVQFLYIAKTDEIKFRDEAFITAKLAKLFNKAPTREDVKGDVFIDFLVFLNETLCLRDAKTNREIEIMLTKYYALYRKNILS